MTRQCNLDRRRFLQKLAAGILSVSSAVSLVWAGPIGSLSPVERVLSLLPCRRSTRHVGRALLRTHGEPIDVGTLLGSILGEDWRSLLAAAADESLLELLEARRRQDFAAERVVMFDGWVLAQSEVDLCILSALA